jgi:hypothetical protein
MSTFMEITRWKIGGGFVGWTIVRMMLLMSVGMSLLGVLVMLSSVQVHAQTVAYRVDQIQTGAPSAATFASFSGAIHSTESAACAAAGVVDAVASWAASFGAELIAFNGVVNYAGGRYCSFQFVGGPYSVMYAARVVETEEEEEEEEGESGVCAVDIDVRLAAEAFGVGFLLLASCWALGKGVALVIDLVRG